jgi:hypothetical protein
MVDMHATAIVLSGIQTCNCSVQTLQGVYAAGNAGILITFILT